MEFSELFPIQVKEGKKKGKKPQQSTWAGCWNQLNLHGGEKGDCVQVVLSTVALI